MTVSNGRDLLAIPGPTNLPDAVLQAMHRPSVDIYSGELINLTDTCLADLKTVFGAPNAKTYIYAANGHGGWEAALTNTLSRGDHVLVLDSGRFAVGWGEMGRMVGLEVEVLKGSWQRAVDPAAVEARLAADKAHKIKAVLVVQIDTASGVVNDIPAIRKAMDASGHPALFMVDTVASLGCMPFEMEAWRVDVAMAGSQKGLMTPPGLAFVAANAKARQIHKTANLRTMYWDWTFREGDIHYQKYCGTPPEQLLFAMRKALDLILAEGLPNAFRRHALLAEATRRAVGVWAERGVLGFSVTEPSQRSNSITCVTLDGPYADPLYDYCKTKCGLTLGIGLGDYTGKAFRIAHMGHVNAPMVLGALGVIEMALHALHIPHGHGGVQAAVNYLGEEVKA